MNCLKGREIKDNRKMKYLDNNRSIDNKADEDEFDFLLWKTELNTELLSFWKSITE